jgi:beta-N-acetylhexosaminidase
MKSYKYVFPLICFLLPLFLSGCGKNTNFIGDSTRQSTGESGQAVSGTDASAVGSTEASESSSAPETTVKETAGEENSATDRDVYGTRAEELLSGMTLEEKVGQMFFVRLRKASAISDIKDYHLGGYILFGDDFKDETPDGIRTLINSYQSASTIPMLIGADEEGGTVCRVSKYAAFRSEPFQSPQDLYKRGGFEAIKADTKEKADLLLGLGINVNLAPVCDVSVNSNDFIYRRSFGQDAKETSDYVRTVVGEMKKEGIGSTLKHFPGYGSNGDTHTEMVTDIRDYSQFVQSDFLPFEAGIKAGADSILVSHNIVNSMDEKNPASLSGAVHDILREKFHFQGVIMTDDLSMDAIKKSASDGASAVLAIAAGNDLLVATDFDTQIPSVLDALNKGDLNEEQINAAVVRVLIWKLKLGLLQ